MFKYVSWLLTALILASCGNGGSSQRVDAALGDSGLRWQSFPVAIYVDPFLLADTDSTRDLNDAIHFWENLAGKSLFTLAGAADSSAFSGSPTSPDEIFYNAILFQGPWPFEEEVAGKTIIHGRGDAIEGSIILLNPNTETCTGNCTNTPTRVSQRKLLAHELGHLIGLGHSEDAANIMYPEILPGGSLTSLTVDEPKFQSLTQP